MSAALAALDVVYKEDWLPFWTSQVCRGLRSEQHVFEKLKKVLSKKYEKRRAELCATFMPFTAKRLAASHHLTQPPALFRRCQSSLKMLQLSLNKYVRITTPTSVKLKMSKVKNATCCLERLRAQKQLKDGYLRRVLPALHAVAGHVRICMGRLQVLDSIDNPAESQDEDLLHEALDSVDDFLQQVIGYIEQVRS